MSLNNGQYSATGHGRTYSGHRDPPGQSSVYIPPGDERRESYRLSTFAHYPEYAPVLPSQLALSGFYYTGFRDRVKCFSCGLCVETWVQGDMPHDKKWHKNDCAFANGSDRENIPQSGSWTKFLMTSLQRHPSAAETLVPPVTSSFFNQQVSPNQTLDANELPGNSMQTSSNSEQHTRNSIFSTETHRRELFACLLPVNPHMSSVIDRLETFKPRASIRWPRERLGASIDELVNAGFFFLGERDRVKCWYCNGGLQNWDYDDQPWTEHAKWFPMCEFVLQQKGAEFVERIVSQFPHLNRPRPSTVLPTANLEPLQAPSTSSIVQQNNTNNASRIEKAMAELEYIEKAREMGFDDETIKALLEKKYKANGQFYNTAEEFLEALFDFQKESAPQPAMDVQELRKLEDTRNCKACRKDPSNVVLVPCGHLVLCENCAKMIKHCPLCNRFIKERIKTFRA